MIARLTSWCLGLGLVLVAGCTVSEVPPIPQLILDDKVIGEASVYADGPYDFSGGVIVGTSYDWWNTEAYFVEVDLPIYAPSDADDIVVGVGFPEEGIFYREEWVIGYPNRVNDITPLLKLQFFDSSGNHVESDFHVLLWTDSGDLDGGKAETRESHQSGWRSGPSTTSQVGMFTVRSWSTPPPQVQVSYDRDNFVQARWGPDPYSRYPGNQDWHANVDVRVFGYNVVDNWHVRPPRQALSAARAGVGLLSRAGPRILGPVAFITMIPSAGDGYSPYGPFDQNYYQSTP